MDYWKGEARVPLMRRSFKNAEDFVELHVPTEKASEDLMKAVGDRLEYGHFLADGPTIDGSIFMWLLGCLFPSQND